MQPELPAWLVRLGAFLLVPLFRKRFLYLPAAWALGFCWALGMAQLRLADRLAPELEGRDIEVVGVVASLPAAGERSLRFEFEPEFTDARLPGRILLSWYRSPFYEATRHPSHTGPSSSAGASRCACAGHTQFNPQASIQAWLSNGGGGTGYVRSDKILSEKLGTRNSFSDQIEKIRESVRDRFKRVLAQTPASGALAALAVGDQRIDSRRKWRLYNRTGVTHLMSISGLHVTLVSGLCAWLASWLWRRSAFLICGCPRARRARPRPSRRSLHADRRLRGPAQRTF